MSNMLSPRLSIIQSRLSADGAKRAAVAAYSSGHANAPMHDDLLRGRYPIPIFNPPKAMRTSPCLYARRPHLVRRQLQILPISEGRSDTRPPVFVCQHVEGDLGSLSLRH